LPYAVGIIGAGPAGLAVADRIVFEWSRSSPPPPRALKIGISDGSGNNGGGPFGDAPDLLAEASPAERSSRRTPHGVIIEFCR
jgi:hypothetical protein